MKAKQKREMNFSLGRITLMIAMVATWCPLQKQWVAEAARLSSRDQTGAAEQELQLE